MAVLVRAGRGHRFGICGGLVAIVDAPGEGGACAGMVLAGVLICAVILGLARGGTMRAMGRHRWHLPFLPVLAVAMQIVGFLPDESASQTARVSAAALHGLSYVVAAAFVWANRKTPWFWLIGLGLVANALVIIVNGGFMPVSADAVAGSPGAVVTIRGTYNNTRLMAPDTPLWFLGDVLATPRWLGLHRVFSIGDAAIAAAALGLVQHLMGCPRLLRRRAGG